MAHMTLILMLFVLLAGAAHAGVNVVGLFSDNMVLQRDREVPVWGGGKAGEQVTVTFLGAEKTTTVDDTGQWMMKIGPFPAGGPHELRITQGAATLTINNVLVGEVWLCSGQSNMQWGVKNMNNAATEIAAATYPTIRHITIAGTASKRQRVIPSGGLVWRECSPETVGDLSAVAFFFARELQQTVKVPIGLIVTAQGSSPIRSWISAETMHANPIFTDTLAEYQTLPARRKIYEDKRAAYEQALAKSKADGTAPPPWVGFIEWDSYPGPYFYGRVYPLAPFAMRGVIWYQGENEAITFQETCHSKTYRAFFPVMIAE